MTQLKSRLCVLAVSLLAVLPLLAVPVAIADPAPGARITGVEPVDDRWVTISVYSPSMDKVIVNDVYKAQGSASAPVFYLPNGIDGGLDHKDWSVSPTFRASSPTGTSRSEMQESWNTVIGPALDAT